MEGLISLVESVCGKAAPSSQQIPGEQTQSLSHSQTLLVDVG